MAAGGAAGYGLSGMGQPDPSWESGEMPSEYRNQLSSMGTLVPAGVGAGLGSIAGSALAGPGPRQFLGQLIGAGVGGLGAALPAAYLMNRNLPPVSTGSQEKKSMSASCSTDKKKKYVSKMSAYLHHLADKARDGNPQTKQASLNTVYKLAAEFGATGNLLTALSKSHPTLTVAQHTKLAAQLVRECQAYRAKVAEVAKILKQATVMMGGAAPAAPAAAPAPRMAPSRSTTVPAAGGVSALASAGA
jgi:hypothetical protein